MNVNIAPRAKKELKAFPKEVIEQVLKKLQSISADPLHHLERLQGYSLWKLRIGDYRAIIFVETKTGALHVIKIGHRKNIYEKL